MLSAHAYPILLLFHSYIILTQASVECNNWNWSKDPKPKILADCHAALDIIPDGTITFDGIVRKPLHFTLPPRARDPRVLVPALFRSGHCAISVVPEIAERGDHFPVELALDAASSLYFKVFPVVRKVARSIIGRCLPEERTGYTGGTAIIDLISGSDDTRFTSYVVSAHTYLAGPLIRLPFDEHMNVYEADESGKITRSRY